MNLLADRRAVGFRAELKDAEQDELLEITHIVGDIHAVLDEGGAGKVYGASHLA